MATTDLEIGAYEVGGLRVTFEGRTAWLGVMSGDPADMRDSAARLEAEAEDRLYRARRWRALADHYEAYRAEEKARRAAQRNARAAATRARNADPFGFGATSGEEGR